MDLILNQLLGFAVGILSSWALWYYLLHVKPRIEISTELAYNPENDSLHIKIRNSRRRQVADLQASIAVVERKPDGRLITLHTPTLKRDTLFALAPIQELQTEWGIPATIVFSTNEGKIIIEKLNGKSDGERRIIFVLSATDGLSGSKVVQQVTFKSENIKRGKFGLGFLIEGSM